MKNLGCSLFFMCFVAFTGYTQLGFQRVYNHHELDTISIIRDVYLHNDSIYFNGGGVNYGIHGMRFGKVAANGDLEAVMRYEKPNHVIRAYFNRVDADTNYRGNLVNVFKGYDAIEYGYRLLEYSLDAEIVFDTLYNVPYTDSVIIFDQIYTYHDRLDSSYVLVLNYYNDRENGTGHGIGGVYIQKVSHTGEIQWITDIYNPNYNNTANIGGYKIERISPTMYKLHHREDRHGNKHSGGYWAKQHFVTLDNNGNILNDQVFQDGDYCQTFSEALFDGDTIYLQYYDSEYANDGILPHTAYYKLRPVLAKIGPNMQLIWKKELTKFWGTGVSPTISMKRIRKINDSTFIGAYQYYDLLTPDSVLPIRSSRPVRLINFSSEGEFNWIRDYFYYTDLDSINDPSYEINDVEIMPDGGFVFGGYSYHGDSISMGIPGQFAYLLRTNCLGFLAPPAVDFSYSTSENEINFVNTSFNSGSYTWYFGDGDSLSVGEGQDTLKHTYSSYGDYTVTLIGHGCNGEADTIQKTVTIDKNYGVINEGSYFVLYPNPVSSDGLITLENGHLPEVDLYFYDALGKQIKTVFLPNAKSTYFIEHNFSAGMYSAVLIKNGAVIESKRFVVD